MENKKDFIATIVETQEHTCVGLVQDCLPCGDVHFIIPFPAEVGAKVKISFKEITNKSKTD